MSPVMEKLKEFFKIRANIYSQCENILEICNFALVANTTIYWWEDERFQDFF